MNKNWFDTTLLLFLDILSIVRPFRFLYVLYYERDIQITLRMPDVFNLLTLTTFRHCTLGNEWPIKTPLGLTYCKRMSVPKRTHRALRYGVGRSAAEKSRHGLLGNCDQHN